MSIPTTSPFLSAPPHLSSRHHLTFRLLVKTFSKFPAASPSFALNPLTTISSLLHENSIAETSFDSIQAIRKYLCPFLFSFALNPLTTTSSSLHENSIAETSFDSIPSFSYTRYRRRRRRLVVVVRAFGIHVKQYLVIAGRVFVEVRERSVVVSLYETSIATIVSLKDLLARAKHEHETELNQHGRQLEIGTGNGQPISICRSTIESMTKSFAPGKQIPAERGWPARRLGLKIGLGIGDRRRPEVDGVTTPHRGQGRRLDRVHQRERVQLSDRVRDRYRHHRRGRLCPPAWGQNHPETLAGYWTGEAGSNGQRAIQWRVSRRPRRPRQIVDGPDRRCVESVRRDSGAPYSFVVPSNALPSESRRSRLIGSS